MDSNKTIARDLHYSGQPHRRITMSVIRADLSGCHIVTTQESPKPRRRAGSRILRGSHGARAAAGVRD